MEDFNHVISLTKEKATKEDDKDTSKTAKAPASFTSEIIEAIKVNEVSDVVLSTVTLAEDKVAVRTISADPVKEIIIVPAENGVETLHFTIVAVFQIGTQSSGGKLRNALYRLAYSSVAPVLLVNLRVVLLNALEIIENLENKKHFVVGGVVANLEELLRALVGQGFVVSNKKVVVH